jgi:hypothetical protein
MPEKPSQPAILVFNKIADEMKAEKERIKERIDRLAEIRIQLAKKLGERTETFPFKETDFNDTSRKKLEEADKIAEEECPGYITPIGTIIEKFISQGFKVVAGTRNKDVFLVPWNSNNIEEESVLPRHLNATDGMDPDLRKLIKLSKAIEKACVMMKAYS